MIKETHNASVFETEEGELRVNQYLIKESIGKGSFGIVSLAVDINTNKTYAAKEFSKSRLRKKKVSNILRPSGKGSIRGKHNRFAIRAKGIERGVAEDPMDLVKGEIAILKKLNHKNVVKLYEVLDAKEDDALYMMFELCEKGPILNVRLNDQFDFFEEDKARNYFKEMVLGVEYLHENGIAHRDLKPDNLLIDSSNTLKIVDFGVSEMFEKGHEKIKGSTGSPAFMAPELFNAGQNELSVTAIDIWAMGIILYCMVLGRMPFSGENVLEIRDSITEKGLSLPETMNPNLKDLLSKLLEKDPEKRIIMNDIRNHPWLTQNGQFPLPTPEENLANSVEELTDQDVNSAISSIGSVLKVLQAVSKLKHLRQRSIDKAAERFGNKST